MNKYHTPSFIQRAMIHLLFKDKQNEIKHKQRTCVFKSTALNFELMIFVLIAIVLSFLILGTMSAK